MTIETIVFTGSTTIPDNHKVLHINCYTTTCIVAHTEKKYEPVIVNFLIYDFWYILVLFLFALIGFKAYKDQKKNFNIN